MDVDQAPSEADKKIFLENCGQLLAHFPCRQEEKSLNEGISNTTDCVFANWDHEQMTDSCQKAVCKLWNPIPFPVRWAMFDYSGTHCSKFPLH